MNAVHFAIVSEAVVEIGVHAKMRGTAEIPTGPFLGLTAFAEGGDLKGGEKTEVCCLWGKRHWGILNFGFVRFFLLFGVCHYILLGVELGIFGVKVG